MHNYVMYEVKFGSLLPLIQPSDDAFPKVQLVYLLLSIHSCVDVSSIY